jgi:hypothetical protein
LVTAIWTEPAAVRSLSTSLTVSSLVLTKVVAREAPFHVAEEPATNPLPVTVSKLPASLTVTVPGVTDETVGTGFFVAGEGLDEPPPPQAERTKSKKTATHSNK